MPKLSNKISNNSEKLDRIVEATKELESAFITFSYKNNFQKVTNLATN